MSRLQGRGCCGKQTFPTEDKALQRLEKIQRLGLRNELPTGVEQCRAGWHLHYPETDSGPSAKVRAQVEARDASRCVRCGKPWTKGVDSIHHRLPRGRGGGNEIENLILLCGTGTTLDHGWVEKHRAAAYQLGYLVESGTDPADKPVQVAGTGWRYASPDGRWLTPAEYGQAAPDEAVAL